MDKENNNFGYIGGALERTKAYHNSNTVHRYDGILVPGTEQTLDFFSTKHNIELGKSTDTLDDNKLLKYTVQKMNPTKRLGEFENPAEIYIITDAQGFDIGTYDASTGEFKLSPAIVEANKKMIEKCGASELAEEFENPSLGTVVEKLSKGESLVLVNEEQVKDERLKVAKENFKNMGKDLEVDEEEKEMTEEEKAISSLPEGAKAEALNLKEKIGEDIEIKEVLIVNSPTSVSDELGGEENGIRENGGPVVMIRAASKGADKLNDDMYVFQDEAMLKIDEAKENRFDTLMDQNQGTGVIGNLEDTDKDKVKDVIAVLVEQRNEEVRKMRASNPEASSEELAYREKQINLELLGNVNAYIKDADYEPDNEVKEIVDNIQEQATSESKEEMADVEQDKGFVGDALDATADFAKDVADGMVAGGIVAAGIAGVAEGVTEEVDNKKVEENDEKKEEYVVPKSPEEELEDDDYYPEHKSPFEPQNWG